MIRYPDLNHTQLFDLQHDPYELKNLAEDQQFQEKKEQMMALLAKHQQNAGDTLSLTPTQLRPMEYDLSNYQRVPDKWQPEYTLKKYFGKGK